MKLRSDRGLGGAFVAMALAGCIGDADDQSIPSGAELVLTAGDFEVWLAPGTVMCPGSVSRLERHVAALSDAYGVVPSAVLVLYDTPSLVSEQCSLEHSVHGCTGEDRAAATVWAAPHEAVHLFTRAATGVDNPVPAVSEGLAYYLQGEYSIYRSSSSSLVELFGASAFDLDTDAASHLAAWAIDQFGLDAVLEAHAAAAVEEGPSLRAAGFADALGLPGTAALEAAYAEQSAMFYPRPMNTLVTYSSQQASAGIAIDTSCEGGMAEGLARFPAAPGQLSRPEGPLLRTIVRFEVDVAGEHEIRHLPGIEWEDFELRYRPSHPTSAEFEDVTDVEPIRCSLDSPHPRYRFEVPGAYELVLVHGVDTVHELNLVVVATGSDQCS